jgi:hypothetical protein
MEKKMDHKEARVMVAVGVIEQVPVDTQRQRKVGGDFRPLPIFSVNACRMLYLVEA